MSIHQLFLPARLFAIVLSSADIFLSTSVFFVVFSIFFFGNIRRVLSSLDQDHARQV